MLHIGYSTTGLDQQLSLTVLTDANDVFEHNLKDHVIIRVLNLNDNIYTGNPIPDHSDLTNMCHVKRINYVNDIPLVMKILYIMDKTK